MQYERQLHWIIGMTKHGLNIFQCTEDNHRDRKDLVGAVAIMSAVASFINESKRRKDISEYF